MSTKNTLNYQPRYRRKLPHLQPPGATFFITFRLAGSLPNEVWAALQARLDALDSSGQQLQKQEQLWFEEYEQCLHNATSGPVWLADDRIAALVAESLHYHDQQRYRLDAFCIMPNHVHTILLPLPMEKTARVAMLSQKLMLVKDREGNAGYFDQDATGKREFVPVKFHSLASIMHSIKRRTANEGNKLLGRSGTFWQDESYDRFTRDQAEWQRTIRYVLNNPVKAGLVNDWLEWPWNWCRPDW